MALTIVYKNGSEETIHLPFRVKNFPADEISKVHADGDELGHILCNFRNLPVSRPRDFNSDDPTPRGYMQNWYGDHAKFIVGNL